MEKWNSSTFTCAAPRAFVAGTNIADTWPATNHYRPATPESEGEARSQVIKTLIQKFEAAIKAKTRR